MKEQIKQGDCLKVLKKIEENSIDSCVTDPPYGFEFMAQGWDKMVPPKKYWQAMLRVMKPGAYLLAFGGPRTSHRLVCAIEDAGWEIRDSIFWVFGQGFPKSLNVGKAIDKAAGAIPATEAAKLWDGWGTALKPAHEPITLARKPFKGPR